MIRIKFDAGVWRIAVAALVTFAFMMQDVAIAATLAGAAPCPMVAAQGHGMGSSFALLSLTPSPAMAEKGLVHTHAVDVAAASTGHHKARTGMGIAPASCCLAFCCALVSAHDPVMRRLPFRRPLPIGRALLPEGVEPEAGDRPPQRLAETLSEFPHITRDMTHSWRLQ